MTKSLSTVIDFYNKHDFDQDLENVQKFLNKKKIDFSILTSIFTFLNNHSYEKINEELSFEEIFDTILNPLFKKLDDNTSLSLSQFILDNVDFEYIYSCRSLEPFYIDFLQKYKNSTSSIVDFFQNPTSESILDIEKVQDAFKDNNNKLELIDLSHFLNYAYFSHIILNVFAFFDTFFDDIVTEEVNQNKDFVIAFNQMIDDLKSQSELDSFLIHYFENASILEDLE